MQRSPRVSYRHQHRGNIWHLEGWVSPISSKSNKQCHDKLTMVSPYYCVLAVRKGYNNPLRPFLTVVLDLLLVTTHFTQFHIPKNHVYPHIQTLCEFNSHINGRGRNFPRYVVSKLPPTMTFLKVRTRRGDVSEVLEKHPTAFHGAISSKTVIYWQWHLLQPSLPRWSITAMRLA